MKTSPLGILGMMAAGASALAPDDAEAAMIPGARKALLKIIGQKGVKRKPDGRVLMAEPKRPSVEVGYWEPRMLKEAQKAYPDANNRIFTNAHDLGKRFNQLQQLPRETLDQLQALLDAKRGMLVRNYSTAPHASPYGMLARDSQGYIFSPLSVRHGDFYLDGVMRPTAGQLKAMRGGWRVKPSYPGQARPNPGAPSTKTTSGAQLFPLSAVTPQENPYLQQQPRPVNQDPYLKDAIERDPIIDPISAIFWGGGLGGLAKGAASKGIGYASDLFGGGILDGFLSGDGAQQENKPFNDTYDEGMLWHLGLKN